MVQLQGSEKQVTWAEEIRAQHLAAVQEEISQTEKALADKPSPRREKWLQKVRALVSTLERIPAAAWWINERGSSVVDLIARANPGSYANWLGLSTDLLRTGGEEAIKAAVFEAFGEYPPLTADGKIA